MNLYGGEIAVFCLTAIFAFVSLKMWQLYRSNHDYDACLLLSYIFGCFTVICLLMSIICISEIREDYGKEYTMTYKVHYCDGSSKTCVITSARAINVTPSRYSTQIWTYENGQRLFSGEVEIVSYTYKKVK
jgi:hypothetical protein